MHPFEARHAARRDLNDATARLVADFSTLPAGTVIGCVGRAREELLRAGVREGLAVATESMARQWLSRHSPVHAG